MSILLSPINQLIKNRKSFQPKKEKKERQKNILVFVSGKKYTRGGGGIAHPSYFEEEETLIFFSIRNRLERDRRHLGAICFLSQVFFLLPHSRPKSCEIKQRRNFKWGNSMLSGRWKTLKTLMMFYEYHRLRENWQY